MKTTFNDLLSKVGVVAVAFVIALAATYVYADWTGPSATPPGNNTDTPINVGTTAQTKLGGLGVTFLCLTGDTSGTPCRSEWPTSTPSNASNSSTTLQAGNHVCLSQNPVVTKYDLNYPNTIGGSQTLILASNLQPGSYNLQVSGTCAQIQSGAGGCDLAVSNSSKGKIAVEDYPSPDSAQVWGPKTVNFTETTGGAEVDLSVLASYVGVHSVLTYTPAPLCGTLTN